MRIEKIGISPETLCQIYLGSGMIVKLKDEAFKKLFNEKFYGENKFEIICIDEDDFCINLKSTDGDRVIWYTPSDIIPYLENNLAQIFAESLVFTQHNLETLKTRLNDFFGEEVKIWQSGDMGEEDGLESDIPTNERYEVYVDSSKISLTFFYGEFKKPITPEREFIILETSVDYIP